MIRPAVALYSRPNASPACRLRSLYQRRADRSSRAASGWTRSLSVGLIGVDEPLSFVPRQRRHAAAVCFGQSPRDAVLDGLRGRPERRAAAVEAHQQLASDLRSLVLW